MKSQLDTFQIADLRWHFADDLPDLVFLLEDEKWLQPGQGIEALSPEHADNILGSLDLFFGKIKHLRRKREREAEAQRQHNLWLEKSKRDRQSKLGREVPSVYRHLSKERSPRPRQFCYVESYYVRVDADDNLIKRPEFESLLLHGGSGTGKTAAAWAAYQKEALEFHELEFCFKDTVEFIRLAKGRHLSRDDKQEFEKSFENMKWCDGLLVLDDFGTENFKGTSAEEVVFELIDNRTKWDRQTIITTNYTIPQLARMFTDKNAEKVLRRIRQYFLGIDFNKP